MVYMCMTAKTGVCSNRHIFVKIFFVRLKVRESYIRKIDVRYPERHSLLSNKELKNLRWIHSCIDEYYSIKTSMLQYLSYTDNPVQTFLD